MSNAKHSPDLLFEVSWEVCNKVGGIHTVISTKAQTVTRKFADRYVLLGPDLSHEGVNPEFEEDPNQLKAWRQSLYNEGIRVRVGRWKIKASGNRTTWTRSRASGTTSSRCCSDGPQAS